MTVGVVGRFEAPSLYNLDGFLVQSRTKPSHNRNMLCASLDSYHGLYHDGPFDFGLQRSVGVIRHRTVDTSRNGYTVDAGSRELSISRFRLRRARDREE
jgi:hypothetical protein